MENQSVTAKRRGFSLPISMLLLALMAMINTAFAQQISTKGKVTDATTGEPIPGVSVREKGTTVGTATDIDGNFVLKVDAKSTLVFSFVGYNQQEVALGGKTTISVALTSSSEKLDELVVVGYGTKKKVNLTGAVATVETKKLETRAQRNLLNSLQGAVSGVTITNKPGGSTSLNIRGVGSTANTSKPLYIVDNVEVTETFFTSLDPASIENMSFLKDASSAAIYGAKAAYGVVLVTTKRGKDGALSVVYNGSYGIQRPNLLPKVLNSGDYAEMLNTAETNSGIAESGRTFTQDMIAKYRSGENTDLYPNTNWLDLLLRDNSAFTRHNLQFNGTSGKTNYILGLGYVYDESMSKGVDNKRYNFLTKTNTEFKKWLSVTSSVNFIYSNYDRTTGSTSLVEALRVPPTMVAKHSNGNYGSIKNGRLTSAADAQSNPLRTLEQGGRGNSGTKQLLGSVAAELRPLEGLKITNQLAYNYYDYRSFSFSNTMAGIPNYLYPNTGIIDGTSKDVNQMDMTWNYNEKLIYDLFMNYDKKFNKIHEFSVLAGFHADQYVEKSLYVGRKNFSSNDMGSINGGSTDPADQMTTTGGIGEESLMSYFGRLSYTYNNRYLFEANYRADASSLFKNVGRWSYFPSVSLGWRLDQEEFMKGLTWINALKIRGSWGQGGNINNIGRYDTYSTYSTGGTIIIGDAVNSTVSEGRVANPNLTWETTTTKNLGLDLDIKNGLFTLSAELYDRLTTGILIQPQDVGQETGLDKDLVPSKNVGKVRNKGVEFTASHRRNIGDFSYTVGGNLTINDNKIVSLGDVTELPATGFYLNRTGYAISSFYMYEATGIYSEAEIAAGKGIPYGSQKPEAGMLKYKDQNGDGVINADDRIIAGNETPNFTYGINLELKYKNFTFSMLGQGVKDVKVYLNCEASMAFFDYSVPREWQKDNWTPTNQGATYPKLFLPSDTRYKYNIYQNSFWLFDASYFRIKNVTLSYELPKNILSKIGLERANVYVSADNAYTFRGDKRMKDFDPERISGRSAYLNYQTFTTGINLTF